MNIVSERDSVSLVNNAFMKHEKEFEEDYSELIKSDEFE